MKTIYILLPLMCLTTGCADFDSNVQEAIQIAQKSQTGGALAPTGAEASSATKQALEKGVKHGINLLHQDGGFSQSIHRILLPPQLIKTTDLARQIGMGKYVDDFEKSLNKAAEQAVGAAAPVFSDAISQLTFTDVVNILRGPDNAATQYFQVKSAAKLNDTFLPIVTKATGKTDVTRLYKQLITSVKPAAMVAGINLPTVDLDRYVTEKAVSALFTEIAVQEKKIRDNPVERTTAMLQKVFSYYEAR